MLKEGEMSLEQLYKMLHVSKRKAAWMLNNGIIPCQIRPAKTHRYIILREDVEAYLQKKRAERRKEILLEHRERQEEYRKQFRN